MLAEPDGLVTSARTFDSAARLLVKDRWFTLATVVALALAIGLNSTMFTVVNAMIRGLPLDHPERILSVNARDGAGQWQGLGLSYLDFLDFRAATTTFSGLAAFIQATTTLGDNERAPERAAAAYLSANTFQVARRNSRCSAEIFFQRMITLVHERWSFSAALFGRLATMPIRH